jgi:hypothetical protein
MYMADIRTKRSIKHVTKRVTKRVSCSKKSMRSKYKKYTQNINRYLIETEDKEITFNIYVTTCPTSLNIGSYVSILLDRSVDCVIDFYHSSQRDTPYDCDIFWKNGILAYNLPINDRSMPNADELYVFDQIIDSLMKIKQNLVIVFQCQPDRYRSAIILYYLMVSRCGWYGYTIDAINFITKQYAYALNVDQIDSIMASRIKKYKDRRCTIL